ncbi:MAG TPA: hypothetical protein VM287_01515 [Egibacteraceae bacterium]|nr:hypothetical protein [Egibacteraceae bacterium]
MRRGWALLLAGAILLPACGDGPDLSQPPAGEETQTAPPDSPPPGEQDQDGQPLPDDRWMGLGSAPTPLSEVAAASFGGQVWTAGGFTEQGEATASVQIFDPTFGTWSTGPELPEPVHHSALVSAGDALYLLGGYVGSGFSNPTAAVRRLDTGSGQWTDGPPLPEARAAGAAAWDGERVVYGGGVGPSGLAGDVVGLEGDRWSPVGELSRAREHLAAAGDGQGRVWFLAGRTGGLDTNLATVDLVEGDDVRPLGEVPTPRGGVAAFWAPAAGACVVGGEQPDGTFADVECVDADGTVTVLPSLGMARHGLGAAVVENAAYVALGGREPGLSVSGVVEALRLGGQE